MTKFDVKEIITEFAIAGLNHVAILIWCIDNIFIKFGFFIIPTLIMFISFIIILFAQDLLRPEYSILESMINALIYAVVYCVLLVGDYSANEHLDITITFPCKIFLVLGGVFYCRRIYNAWKLYFVPLGPIVGTLLGYYTYFNFENKAIFIATGTLVQVIFNAILFPPQLVKSMQRHKKTE